MQNLILLILFSALVAALFTLRLNVLLRIPRMLHRQIILCFKLPAQHTAIILSLIPAKHCTFPDL